MSEIAKKLASNIMDLLSQFNPDDYSDSPGYERSLNVHTVQGKQV